MNIQIALNTVNSFAELKSISQQAKSNLSFWGSREVSATGYEGTIPLDALAERVIQLLHQKQYEFNENERAVGLALVWQINRIYDEHDLQYDQSGILTKLLTNWNAFVLTLIKWSDIRNKWEGDIKWRYGERSSFAFYTKLQFQNRFGFPPEEANQRGYYAEMLSMKTKPTRWAAPVSRNH